MQRQTSRQSNGQTRPASNEVELYELLIQPTVDDPFLSRNNLGLGNYSRREFWQQVDSFKKGLYAEAAFARRLFDRAVYQTKCALARKMFEAKAADEEPDADGIVRVDDLTLNEYVGENAERCWAALDEQAEQLENTTPTQLKMQALEEHAGLTREWTSPFHRMIMARHEASRSRFARVLDNATGRIREIRGDNDAAVQEQLGRH
jgi:hypothetical protein